MYAVVSETTGVIRQMSESFITCVERKEYEEHFGYPCVIVKIPQLMLDDFGARLLEIRKQEEVSE